MYKALRIVFCILAAAAAAAAVFIFVFYGWLWGFITIAACAIFAAGMFVCRNLQFKEEEKKNPPPAKGDYITGRADDETKK